MKTVYDMSLERVKKAFDSSENVLVAFSGGKDSGVCLNLCYEYAKKTNQLDKLAVYTQDYEAGYDATFQYIERVFDNMPEIRKFWCCLPYTAACSVSMFEPTWTPWNPDEKDIWVRTPPEKDYVYTMDNIFYDFKKGTSGYQFRIDFAQEFANKFGSTSVIIGLRQDESLSRRAIITSKQRRNMLDGLSYTTVLSENVTNFYPIHDWKTEDIWVANYKFNWDYNKLYDLYYQAGLSIHQMRTASPFHSSGQDTLNLYKVINPTMWSKMVSRVNGVNFGGIYGGTTAMGWRSITKPKHFTWKQYAEFLLSTLPEKTRKIYEEKIAKSQWHWRVQGGARDEKFIQQLEKEGVKLRRTGRGSVACKVNTHKELIYIDEMMDDTDVEEFRKAPSWKRVCVTILKNDTKCLYMGFSRTKSDLEKRKNAIKKYKEIL
ncbi:DUF3440 domain-containing protein [Streptococcus oralis]|uniref:DUF3440 domain-containing protein n=1 Tax=Streptococcus oralis TaxID=1303 RepID=UPI0022849ED6|nr:DUF3440 domain-containing protein [Streptococcus oralis]MCY7080043.1 DUF3440 domain-containing protein [Streptococcus oralis]